MQLHVTGLNMLSITIISIILLKGWQLPHGFSSVRTIYSNLYTQIFLFKHGKFENKLTLGGDTDFFTTFDKDYFALKQL